MILRAIRQRFRTRAAQSALRELDTLSAEQKSAAPQHGHQAVRGQRSEEACGELRLRRALAAVHTYSDLPDVRAAAMSHVVAGLSHGASAWWQDFGPALEQVLDEVERTRDGQLAEVAGEALDRGACNAVSRALAAAPMSRGRDVLRQLAAAQQQTIRESHVMPADLMGVVADWARPTYVDPD